MTLTSAFRLAADWAALATTVDAYLVGKTIYLGGAGITPFVDADGNKGAWIMTTA